MGGASTQISYAVPEKKAEGNEDVTEIQLYGQTHNVLSQSNLCFGRDQANARYRSLLLVNNAYFIYMFKLDLNTLILDIGIKE